MAFTENMQHGCVYMTSDKISAKHMFTTRIGGASKGVFASWNLGVNRGDDDAAVSGLSAFRASARSGTDLCSAKVKDTFQHRLPSCSSQLTRSAKITCLIPAAFAVVLVIV